MSASERLRVGVVVERRPVASRWVAGDSWLPVGLLPGDPDVEPWTVLGESADGSRRYYAGTVEIRLFSGETDGYRDNLAGSRPAVYIVLSREAEGVGLRTATVDTGEAEAHADSGDDIVEAVPMPPWVAAWVGDFVARHHVERPFYKRQRDRPDPEALARGRRPGGGRSDDGGDRG